MFERSRRLLAFGLTGMLIIAASRPAEADHTVGITNAGTRPITSVFLSVPGLNDWGEDRLHGNQLRPGYTLTVRLNDQCQYDVLVAYAGGGHQLSSNQNTCHENVVFR
jgi:hypothetical protein